MTAPRKQAKGSGDFSIGTHVWPGTAKIQEETAELNQVLGKLVAVSGETKHWSYDLREKLIEEIGDALGAIQFFCDMNMTEDMERISERAAMKRSLFHQWQSEWESTQPADVPAEATRIGKILYLPFERRARALAESAELDVATEWLLSELDAPPTVAGLRAKAKLELKAPRDAIHRAWADRFLRETEEHEK